MKLQAPLLYYNISQVFGGNANPFYAGLGLKGHPGLDLVHLYNVPIFSATDGIVYKVVNKNNPDPQAYRAVFVLTRDEQGNWAEVSYGHCDKIFVTAGSYVVRGDCLATVGNTGDVYSQGVPVTKEQKLAGSRAGHHLHFQRRPVLQASVDVVGKTYLTSINGGVYRGAKGNCYEIPAFGNGYNGCDDPLPDLYRPNVAQVVLMISKATKAITGKVATS